MTWYRVKDQVDAGHGGVLEPGTLLFPPNRSGRVPGPGKVVVSNQANGWGYGMEVPLAALEVNPQPRWTEFEDLLRFYLTGRAVPPNLEVGTAETLDRDLNAVAHAGALGRPMMGGRVLLPTMDQNRDGELAMAVLGSTQGGMLDGQAHVLFYLPSWMGREPGPRTASFRICAHELVTGQGANPSRGWHPSHCRKCDLNTSVDSGD